MKDCRTIDRRSNRLLKMRGCAGVTSDGLTWRTDEYSSEGGLLPHTITVHEETRRGTYSRLADEVRRELHAIQYLERITVSQNAPGWRRNALETNSTPKGLTTIKTYAKRSYTEVWYKTATNGHRAKIFVRGKANDG